jgi:hypothetical protein
MRDHHEAERVEELREEARYRRERLALYNARLYGGSPLDESKLRELQRSSDGSDERLRHAEKQGAASRPPA